jgi:hypothetical protein
VTAKDCGTPLPLLMAAGTSKPIPTRSSVRMLAAVVAFGMPTCPYGPVQISPAARYEAM